MLCKDLILRIVPNPIFSPHSHWFEEIASSPDLGSLGKPNIGQYWKLSRVGLTKYLEGDGQRISRLGQEGRLNK